MKGSVLNINLKLAIKSQEVQNLMPEQRLKKKEKKSATKPDLQVIKAKQNQQRHNLMSFYTPCNYSEHCLVYLGNYVASV